LKAPRAGAIAGILFSILLIASQVLIRVSVPANSSWAIERTTPLTPSPQSALLILPPIRRLLALARNREQYLKEIDHRQPIPMTKASMEPLIRFEVVRFCAVRRLRA
jgi:hypothetical protein